MNIVTSSSTLLDVAPYDVFTVTCTAIQPSSIIIAKTIDWSQTNESGVTQPLSNNGDYINITTVEQDSTTVSMLSVRVSEAGGMVYTCTAQLEVPGDPVIVQAESVEIVVKGE